MQDRPSTKVHAAPGGGSSLGYLFGGVGGGNWLRYAILPDQMELMFVDFCGTRASDEAMLSSFI